MLLGLPAGWLLCECVLCSPTNIWALSQVLFTIVPFIENLSRTEEDTTRCYFLTSYQSPSDALPFNYHPDGKSQSDLPVSLLGATTSANRLLS